MREQIPRRFFARMAERFAALADGTRLMVIHCLLKSGEQNVTQIVEATGQTHQNVSKHLRHLRDAGLVACRKEGLQVFYWLNDPVVEKLCHLVSESLVDELAPEGGEENPCEDAG
jgi:ArsR family transcriptional regulator